MSHLRAAIPRGSGLAPQAWARRHRGIVILLWAHAAVIPVFALIQGYSIAHTLMESAPVPALALIASLGRPGRRLRTLASAAGLLTSSAVLVHLSGGLIEMHFHFFVMVAVVAMYQDWLPFLTTIGYVLIHHGVMGALDPESVFNHPAAILHPWKWAGIHALFIAAISFALIVYWNLTESAMRRQQEAEERLRRESRIVATLNEIGASLTADLSLSHVVQRVTDVAREFTAAQYGSFFYRLDERADAAFMLLGLSGPDPSSIATVPMPRLLEIFGEEPAGERIVRITAAPDDLSVQSFFGLPDDACLRSYMAVPVASRRRIAGALLLAHSDPGMFSDDDEKLAAGIAAHAAVAIESADAYEAERHARATAEAAQHRFGILAEASRVLLRSLDLDTMLRDLSRLVVPAIADAFIADIVSDDGSVTRVTVRSDDRYITFSDADEPPAPDLDDESDLIAQTIRSRAAALVEDVPESLLATDAGRAHGRPIPPSTAVIVPLISRDRTVGALTLVTVKASGRRLGRDDLTLLEDLARRTAVAVENATLFARQRTAAEILQHALLPAELPDIPGVVTAARYVAGGPGVEVGGDWYDGVALPGGTIVFAMGDVVGRGIPAAALMGQLRNALRAYALDGHGPAQVLTKLNGLLNELAPSDQMATLVVAVLSPDSGELCLASAGHPPPLLMCPNGKASFFEGAAGVPLGVMPHAVYSEDSIMLEPGTTIVLYTDGLVEQRDRPLDSGLEILRAGAQFCGGDDLNTLCDALLQIIPSAAEGSDDVAILAIGWLSLGDHLELSLPARPSVLQPLRATLRRWLTEAGATDEEIFEILVATGEAVANVIRHASAPAAETFELEAHRNGDIRIAVRDRGIWRPPAVTRPGGRGIQIMRELMDDVDLAQTVAGTAVTMRRSLMRPDGARRLP